MVQHVLCKFLSLPVGQILANPSGIEARLIHSHQTDGGEMVFKGSQVPFCIGVQPVVQKPCDHLSLCLQGTGRHIHHVIQAVVKIVLIHCQISDSRHIDRHYAY